MNIESHIRKSFWNIAFTLHQIFDFIKIPFCFIVAAFAMGIYMEKDRKRNERQINETEYAALNFCNAMHGGRCDRNSIACHKSIDDQQIDFCAVSYHISYSANHEGNEMFSCKCKNLVCEVK
jgi:hypothetical protein